MKRILIIAGLALGLAVTGVLVSLSLDARITNRDAALAERGFKDMGRELEKFRAELNNLTRGVAVSQAQLSDAKERMSGLRLRQITDHAGLLSASPENRVDAEHHPGRVRPGF